MMLLHRMAVSYYIEMRVVVPCLNVATGMLYQPFCIIPDVIGVAISKRFSTTKVNNKPLLILHYIDEKTRGGLRLGS